MKVYLVYDRRRVSPFIERVVAVMHSPQDAEQFKKELPFKAEVVERTLIWGQPTTRGYNP